MFSSICFVGLSVACGGGPIQSIDPASQAVGGTIVWPETGVPQTGGYHFGPTDSGIYPFVSRGTFSEALYPYDAPEPWMHGHFQEIPAYGGFHAFRPYNYKHVLAQSQAAVGWGMSPTMPYSQQFWRRYHRRASMRQPPAVRRRRGPHGIAPPPGGKPGTRGGDPQRSPNQTGF